MLRCHHSPSQTREMTRSSNIFRTENDDSGGAIANFLVLCAAQVNHGAGSRMCHIHFSKDGVAIISQNNASHGVQKHFEHGARSKGGTHDVRNSLFVHRTTTRKHGD